MTTYAILGAGCCFAQHTALHLLDHGVDRVVGVGRHGPAWNWNLVINKRDHCTFAVQDIRKTDELIALLRSIKPSVIINFAAEGESGGSFHDAAKYFDTNCTALVRLVEGLHNNSPWLKRFVQVSSGEVYGSVIGPSRETDPLWPTSPYAASKAAFDHFLVAYHKRRMFPMNIVRPSNTYGEGQQLYRIVPKAIMFGLTGKQMPLYGSGKGEKSYLHVSDMAAGIAMVADRAPLGRIYNLAPRLPVTTRDLCAVVARLLGISETQLYHDVGLRRGTDARYWLDSQAAEKDFGWTPRLTLAAGIKRMIEWHRERLEFLTAQLPEELKRQPVPQPIGV